MHSMMGVLAIGTVVLVVWIVRRAAQPEKLTLRHTPGRSNTLGAHHLLVLVLAWLAITSLARYVLGRWLGEADERPRIIAAIVGYTALSAGAVLVAKLCFRWGLRRGLGLSGRRLICDVARGLLGYLAVVPVCYALLAAIASLLPPDLKQTHEMLVALVEVPPVWQLLVVIATVILAPIAEELLFRGLIQSMLRQKLGNPWLAIAITSLLFSLIHAPYWHTTGAIAALSVALGYNYERCGRLLPSIVMHAAFNAVSVWMYLANAQ